MINLLPSSEKEVIKQEKINRLIIILGSLILLVLLFLCLLLLSIKIYTSGQAEAQKILVAQEKELAENSKKMGGAGKTVQRSRYEKLSQFIFRN